MNGLCGAAFLARGGNQWRQFCISANDVEQVTHKSKTLQRDETEMTAAQKKKIWAGVDRDGGCDVKKQNGRHQKHDVEPLILHHDFVKAGGILAAAVSFAHANQAQIVSKYAAH